MGSVATSGDMVDRSVCSAIHLPLAFKAHSDELPS